MAIIKCKMCGGDMEISKDKTYGVCEYCGSQMTLPKISDEQRAAAYNRGNHFRRIGEFDKALQVYERIVREDENDAEAHWCCALCRFGIEYVEDPGTLEYIPTCHRASFDNFLEDVDYLAAVEHSEGITRKQYQRDGLKIADVQRGILTTSQNEEPYDVFICYKETDENGDRTRDSALAQDIYYQLTEQGRRVFFARITLEDKVGAEYEPYIFAALHSAKVMVVVGTSAENLNAVWVKNEWSRFLAMMKHNRNKLLLPCYRNMEPYDLPDQLGVLQSYDMSKIGFIQDLTRGISKVLDADKQPEIVNQKVKETVVVQQGNGTEIAPLLKRAFMFLEDGNWDSADEYFERVLDMEPESAEAYLGKLMANLHVKNRTGLKNTAAPFDDDNSYEKAYRFAEERLRKELKDCNAFIRQRNEQARLESIYSKARKEMQAGKSELDYKSAAGQFQSISSYKDAADLAKKCLERAETARKDAIYDSATAKMTGEKVSSYENAIQALKTISGWKDADQQVVACQNKIKEIREKEEQQRLEKERQEECRRQEVEKQKNKNRRIIIIVASVVSASLLVMILMHSVIIPAQKLKETKALLSNSKIGDVILLGYYEQDNNYANGKEEIQWQVLDKQNGKILVISKYALDCKPYNAKRVNTTWEKCTLRTWLNEDFLNDAFTAGQQKIFPTVKVSPGRNPEYSTSPGNETQDQIFLLSIKEANKYFVSDDARICKPTPYAISNNAYDSASGSCWWWLRSPGSSQNSASSVGEIGSVNEHGTYVNVDSLAIRPAMWIDLKS